jgi:AraC-like DNA-binding protein
MRLFMHHPLAVQTHRYPSGEEATLDTAKGGMWVVLRGECWWRTRCGSVRHLSEGTVVVLEKGEHDQVRLTTGAMAVELLALRGGDTFLPHLARALESGARAPHGGDGRIFKAIQIMRADLARRWTVAMLAKIVGLSRPAFARRFLRGVGQSPLRYLARCRMELAAELLRGSEAGIAEIAVQVGYDSEFAFSRAFKRHHGVPPGTFRRTPATVALRCAA